ncbi:AAA domain-containing protein [Lentzea aerocolonigenes]|uniref:AAA domain-containing protein n=1 Tax=Lentzea aerocolonigenes TaxID=68170 RepID=UPI0005ECA33A|nr:AAA domain-containing protein [Lentzea aerocolonigenes]
MAGWRGEVLEAADELLQRTGRSAQGEWKRLGKAVLQGDGWYALDLHTGSRRAPTADSFDQLCFADDEGPEHGTTVPVARALVTDEVLKVKAEGALPKGCEVLWTVRLTPQHLLRKLRDGIAALGDAKLADKLATGSLDPVPARSGDYPPGFLAAQRQAYRACVEPGLHAVWGPPGTGKTRVLARAIEDLVGMGKRVLLVSTANVAVDNALKEVIKHLNPKPGVVLRVGPPHLPELVNNDDVQLERLAARTTAEVDAERQRVQDEIAETDQVDAAVAELDTVLAGYDHQAYVRAQQRLATSKAHETRLIDLENAKAAHEKLGRELRDAAARLEAATAEVARLAPAREELRRAAEMSARLAELDRDLVEERASFAHVEYTVANAGGWWLTRRRNRRVLTESRERLGRFETHVAEQHHALEPLVRHALATAHPVTERDLQRAGDEFAARQCERANSQRRCDEARNHVRELGELCAQLVARGLVTEDDLALIKTADRAGLPGKQEKRERLRVLQRESGREALEARLRDLTARITRLRRDAEGEIVAAAMVVATTLARSRAHPAVARQQFDVVLVDEAGAAVLGEVLLAVARATTTATLLGDFLQLGPVTPEADRSRNAAVRRWFKPDSFTHCGIRAPEHVAADPGCVGLRHQFRFGSNLRRLANDVVYQVLEDGVRQVGGRAPEDTEIVLIDVDGLPQLNQVHRSGPVAGWWPVGALLARSLAQHHVVEGSVGVVTTFAQQADAAHAALRDAGQNLQVPVGTAHSFQGREFDTVVFDLVEDGGGWISKAKWRGGSDFERSGVRLFGVGITRARKRLYLIANGPLAVKAALGETPLGALRALGAAREVQWCRASVLLGLAETVEYRAVSRVEAELQDVLRGLVEVTDIDDEFSFDTALDTHLKAARKSVWMWSPWVAKKSSRFLPLIADAVARGVVVRVFVRTERDTNMRKDSFRRWLDELVRTGAKVIRSEVEHRKVVVIDRRTVLMGSHNPLSQRRSREVMITCQGTAFAERLLQDLQAEKFGDPPVCSQCGRDFELWRSAAQRKGMPYFWRCYQCKAELKII